MAELSHALNVSNEVAISIENMNKWYGTFHVLRDIDLTVYRGERIVIAGPSGSGKSTLIRCINALEEHQKGRIEVDGTVLSSDVKNIDKIRSEVGMCFQHFNLFLSKYFFNIFIILHILFRWLGWHQGLNIPFSNALII